MAARQISTLLLRVGTVPFIIVPFAVTVSPEWPPNLDHGLHIALVCHTGIVLAFIGGLQQAAAIGAPSLPHASSIAGLAIAVAIASCYAVFATALRGVTAHEPMILFCAYMAQSVIERCHVPGMMRKAMLHEERTIPMTVASASLLFMARRAAGGAAALLLLALVGFAICRRARGGTATRAQRGVGVDIDGLALTRPSRV